MEGKKQSPPFISDITVYIKNPKESLKATKTNKWTLANVQDTRTIFKSTTYKCIEKHELFKSKSNKICARSTSKKLQNNNKRNKKAPNKEIYHVNGLQDLISLICQFSSNRSTDWTQFQSISQYDCIFHKFASWF